MAKKEKLPIEVHDHIRKANVLHGYVTTELGEARDHALETGQELMAAKSICPHGRWEDECERLFDGKLRTAQRYMQFAKHLGAIPKAHARALLMHEGTLEGAVKAAKAAAKPKPPKPKPDEPIDVDSEPATPAQVQEAVESVAAEDADDAPLPEEPEEDETIEEIVATHNKAIESFCRGIKKAAGQQPDVFWLDDKGRWDGYMRKIGQALDTLRSAKAVVCPACEGQGCKTCENHGFLPKLSAEGMSK